MAKFIDAYCLDEKDFWGVTCQDVATSTGETHKRIQWLIKKVQRELKFNSEYFYKIKGDSCHRPDDIYALSPEFVIVLCGHIGNWRAFHYGAYMQAFEYRVEFYGMLIDKQIFRKSPIQELEKYQEFIKQAISSGKAMHIKNEMLRMLYQKYEQIRVMILNRKIA